MLKLYRITVLVVAGLTVSAGLPGLVARAQSRDADVVRTLAGVWRAPEYKVKLSSELDKQVSGPDVSRLRNVELAIEPDGDGILKVFTSVVDARGKTQRYSASVVEARLAIGPPDRPTGDWIQPKVTVLSAEERFLDGSGDKWPIEGLTVKIQALEPDGPRLEFRYDTRQGFGSFGETLWRSPRSGRAAAKTS